MLSFSARHTDSLAERTWRRLTEPLVIVVALAWAALAAAASVHTPHVEAELLAERTALVPGEPLTVALRLRMAPRLRFC